MSENRNPEVNKADGTVSEGKGVPQIPNGIKDTEEAKAKLQEIVEAGKETTPSVGDMEFGATSEEGKELFQNKEAAERSYKESQKYIAQLQKEKKELEDRMKSIEVAKEPTEKRDRLAEEVELLKAEMVMERAFRDFTLEHPDFMGNLQVKAKEIILDHIKLNKPIKLKEAYLMAKATSGDFDSVRNAGMVEGIKSERSRYAAVTGMGGSYGSSTPTRPTIELSDREQRMLRGLNLTNEQRDRALNRAYNL